MMFYETQLGSPGATYPERNRFRVPFAFPTPIQTAHAVVRSFHLRARGGDSHIRDLAVILTTHFDPFQSATSGEVEVEFQRTGMGGGIFIESRTIEAQIRILVIGI